MERTLGAMLPRQPTVHQQQARACGVRWRRSHHTLPVTGLHVTRGGLQAAALVVSCSLDRTAKLHSLAGQGDLLAAAQLPCAATCVALDAGEHAMYVGGADGAVYEFSLVGEVPAQQPQDLLGAAAGAGAAGLLEAGGATLRPCAVMAAQSRAVTALSVSVDGELLVSGES